MTTATCGLCGAEPTHLVGLERFAAENEEAEIAEARTAPLGVLVDHGQEYAGVIVATFTRSWSICLQVERGRAPALGGKHVEVEEPAERLGRISAIETSNENGANWHDRLAGAIAEATS